METCRMILQQGLQELNLTADEKQIELLLTFIKLIEKWNKAYNLTAVRDQEDMVRLHLLDSLAILPHIEGNHIADIGTGAGLPGIPLAIFSPNVKFTLVDSNSKKTRFVQQAILELQLTNVSVINNRVENIQTEKQFSSLILRAFSNMQNIITLTRHLIGKQGIVYAMKGQIPSEELVNFNEQYTIIPIKIPGIDAKRCLIRITGIKNG
ncbi:MAG: 16S rRNA (guanine(527)-N(7))-methyltransferase RsmG [Methylococcaceae bacterium]|nr:16S rRNA (guanine(527)-N(7))-methyltransferase RsmG [Methylococcaceae bacterium]